MNGPGSKIAARLAPNSGAGCLSGPSNLRIRRGVGKADPVMGLEAEAT